MATIAFYGTTTAMMRVARKALKKEHPDIRIVGGKPGGGGTELARKLVDQGIEVIIARGGKAMDIKAEGLPVVVVDLRITPFDLLAAVDKARRYGPRIAAISHPNTIENIERLEPVRDVEIIVYHLNRKEDPSLFVRKAIANGVHAVIGGPVTVNAAREQGIPAVLVENEEAGILQAANEAKRIAEARRQERARAGLFSVLLDYSREGFVSIDGDARIFAFNPVAERVLGLRKDQAVGREISQVWPGLKLEGVLASGRDQLGQLLKVNGVNVLCNKVPVRSGQRTIAAVVTFQDVTDIQRMDERVRRRIHPVGHTATVNFEAILGQSQTIRRAIHMAEEFAVTNSSVLILGETGVGKELFAQGVHNHSQRRKFPFVPINCAAVPGSLLESELFGYQGGAFTGANPKGKPGLFEQAHKGTLFLDEIAEMDISLQGKLLRALQERVIMRLGSDRAVGVDVRVIAATNTDLKECVSSKTFRADLYYRLNVLRLRIPPLRERVEDIGLLARFFLDQARGGKQAPTLSEAALQALRSYAWPGNVRELKSFMERIAALHKGGTVSAQDIRELLADEDTCLTPSRPAVPEETDVTLIRRALAQNNHRVAETARQLGISRSTLWRRITKFGLRP